MASNNSLIPGTRIQIRPGRGILVVDSQGLGDVVQSLPLLKAICRWAHGCWPVRVMFASELHYQLVQEEGLEIIPIFARHVRRDLRGLLRLWMQLIGESDLIVCAPEMSPLKLVLLKFATRAPYAIGEASSPFNRFLTHSVEGNWTRPYSETQNQIAAALGIETPLDSPSIRVLPEESEWAKSELVRARFAQGDPIVGIQCSSIVPSKCWPAENFGEFVRRLHSLFPRLKVISFGAGVERASADAAHRIAPEVPWIEATGEWSIRQTLAMLCQCELFVSGDTGLMHMAAALNVRTVSIFGPTSPTRRAPQHNDGIALFPDTACHPCFRGQWTPCNCIMRIKPEQAVAAAEKCLSLTVAAI